MPSGLSFCAATSGLAQENATYITQPSALPMTSVFQSYLGPQGLQIADSLG